MKGKRLQCTRIEENPSHHRLFSILISHFLCWAPRGNGGLLCEFLTCQNSSARPANLGLTLSCKSSGCFILMAIRDHSAVEAKIPTENRWIELIPNQKTVLQYFITDQFYCGRRGQQRGWILQNWWLEIKTLIYQ